MHLDPSRVLPGVFILSLGTIAPIPPQLSSIVARTCYNGAERETGAPRSADALGEGPRANITGDQLEGADHALELGYIG